MGCFIPTPNLVVDVIALVAMKSVKEFCGINNVLPIQVVDEDNITIRTADTVKGMMRSRATSGLIGASESVFNPYGRDCTYHSGAFAEQETFTEGQLRMLAKPGDCMNKRWDATEYINQRAYHQFYRAITRIEATIWSTMFTGWYTNFDAHNNLLRRQYYPIRRLVASPFITDRKNSRPLSIFSSIAANIQDTDVSFFGNDVEYWVNSVTMLAILENTNPEDLGRFNTGVCCSVLTVEAINAVFKSRGLGQFKICDMKYVNNLGVATKFIKDGRCLVIGSLAGMKYSGYFALVRPFNQPLVARASAARKPALGSLGQGIWFDMIDKRQTSFYKNVDIGTGFDGMPIIPRPDRILSLQLF